MSHPNAARVLFCRGLLAFPPLFGQVPRYHPALTVFLANCRLVVVRKRHSASIHSPPVITHTPVCQQSARQFDALRTRRRGHSPQSSTYRKPLDNDSISPTLPHCDQVEPGPTSDFARWDLYPSSARDLALIFTFLLVLPCRRRLATEICSTSSISSSCSPTVGPSEKEREWSACLHWGYCGNSPSQRNVTGCLSSATIAAQTNHHYRPVFPNRSFGAYSIPLGPSSSCQLRALQTSVTHLSLPLPHTQSHSATTLAYESTHASTTGSTRELIALFRFRLPTLADTILRFSLYFDTFQWRVESTSHRRLRYTLARRCVRRWCRC